jgi:hypothetical protein
VCCSTNQAKIQRNQRKRIGELKRDKKEMAVRTAYTCWVPVAHACNPSYSEGKDQEDRSSKPAWVNTSSAPILKKTITKKGWWSGSTCSY